MKNNSNQVKQFTKQIDPPFSSLVLAEGKTIDIKGITLEVKTGPEQGGRRLAAMLRNEEPKKFGKVDITIESEKGNVKLHCRRWESEDLQFRVSADSTPDIHLHLRRPAGVTGDGVPFAEIRGLTDEQAAELDAAIANLEQYSKEEAEILVEAYANLVVAETNESRNRRKAEADAARRQKEEADMAEDLGTVSTE